MSSRPLSPPLPPRSRGHSPSLSPTNCIPPSFIAPRLATIRPRILYRRSHGGDIPLCQQVCLPAPNLTPGFRLPRHFGEPPRELVWFKTGFVQLYFVVLVLYFVSGAVMAGAKKAGCVKAASQGIEVGLVQVLLGVLWDFVKGQGVRHPRMDWGRCVRSVVSAVVVRELAVRGVFSG